MALICFTYVSGDTHTLTHTQLRAKIIDLSLANSAEFFLLSQPSAAHGNMQGFPQGGDYYPFLVSLPEGGALLTYTEIVAAVSVSVCACVSEEREKNEERERERYMGTCRASHRAAIIIPS